MLTYRTFLALVFPQTRRLTFNPIEEIHMGCHTWYYTKVEENTDDIISTLINNSLEYHKAQSSGDIQALLNVFNKQLNEGRKDPLTYTEEYLYEELPKGILQAMSTIDLHTLETVGKENFFSAANSGAIWNWEVNGITYTTHPEKDLLMIEEETHDYPVRFYHYPETDTLTSWNDVLLLLEEYRIFGYHLQEVNPEERSYPMYEGNLEALEQWFRDNPDGYITIG